MPPVISEMIHRNMTIWQYDILSFDIWHLQNRRISDVPGAYSILLETFIDHNFSYRFHPKTRCRDISGIGLRHTARHTLTTMWGLDKFGFNVDNVVSCAERWGLDRFAKNLRPKLAEWTQIQFKKINSWTVSLEKGFLNDDAHKRHHKQWKHLRR